MRTRLDSTHLGRDDKGRFSVVAIAVAALPSPRPSRRPCPTMLRRARKGRSHILARPSPRPPFQPLCPSPRLSRLHARWRQDTDGADSQERHEYGDAPFALSAVQRYQSSKPTRHGPIGRPSCLKVSRSVRLLEQLANAVFAYWPRDPLFEALRSEAWRFPPNKQNAWAARVGLPLRRSALVCACHTTTTSLNTLRR